MTRPWETIDSVSTAEGPLELRKRGDADFLIVIGGRVLMTSVARRSEEALATLACERLARRATPRILLGGLGMGFTLRAALNALPPDARVVVAELTPAVESWCRGPLAPLTDGAVADPRVRVNIVDVADVLAVAEPASLDGILLDLYEGPHLATQGAKDKQYGTRALSRMHAALTSGGVLAVWSEDPDSPFHERLERAGFRVSVHRAGRGGRTHVIYLGLRQEAMGPGRA